MPYPGGNVIRITPTLDTSAISADNVVFFNSTEIPNAVSRRGAASRLVGITVLNEDDVAHDFDLVFMQVETNLGTINGAVGSSSLWTNALAKSAKVLGMVSIDWSTNSCDLINNLVYHQSFGNHAAAETSGLPLFLKAENGKRSVYVAAISRNGNTQSITTAADDYEIILHVEYLD